MQDLTNKKVQLDLATAEAAALDAKSDFLAAMSHELRTPLNAIIGFAETMTMQTFGSLSDQYVSYSNDIMNAGRHLLGLINDILDVAVLESGKLKLEPSESSLKDIVGQALNLVILNANTKNLDTSAISLIDDYSLYVDERRMTQILVNLMSNAVKFTPENGKMGILVNPMENDMLGVSVWDTGIGISQEQQELVFEKFHQDRGHIYSRKEEGTGLGLHISKQLAKQMGGDITLQSAVGEGSTFTVILPLYKP
ncbi:MAG: ATP-binding protein [Proteobacteria bacterium]|nr:ATP-binding protein [Pseudomonadota bacterium]